MSKQNKQKIYVRFATLFLLIPILAIVVIVFATNFYFKQQKKIASAEEVKHASETVSVQVADQYKASKPSVERQFAYYQVQPYETLDTLSSHFGVSVDHLKQLNPKAIVTGETIKIPPVETPLVDQASSSKSLINQLIITDTGDNSISVTGNNKLPLIVVNLNDLEVRLKSMGALEKIDDKKWRLSKSVVFTKNVRINITGQTVSELQLLSSSQIQASLCAENAEILIKDTKITTYDPDTGSADTKNDDSRSFVRARSNSRMDIINSDISYLGRDVPKSNDSAIVKHGGVYGVSWRIPDDAYGEDIVTGWVEGSSFHNNYIGAYTFGASGIMWRGNHFYANEKYGLDPHDDSNNALIENNLFEDNGTHGFIMSKRCNYNIIRNNISRNNKLHGFMLHESSNFNLLENNTADGNFDNMVIFNSNYNIVQNNQFNNARGSSVRVNQNSQLDYFLGNTIVANVRSFLLYDGVNNIYIAQNNSTSVANFLEMKSNTSNIVIDSNHYGPGGFNLTGATNVFETNNVKDKVVKNKK